MNKTRLLSILVIALVLLNVATLAFLIFSGQNGPPHGPQFKNKQNDNAIIKKEFGFDDSQLALFTKSKEKHFQDIGPAESDLRVNSQEFYKLNPDNPSRDSLLNLIIENSLVIYKINIKHFDEVRAICNDDQMKKMDVFIGNLVGNNRHRPKHRPMHYGRPGKNNR